MTEQRGIIREVRIEGGIITLVFEDVATGRRSTVHGDNAPTVRALTRIFGHDIVRGHSLVIDEILNQEIGYSTNSGGDLLTYVYP